MAEDRIRVVVAEPHKPAEAREIPNTLEELQRLVGGYIEVLPSEMTIGRAILVANEEGRLQGLPPNREWKGTVLVGTVVALKADEEGDFASLTLGEAEEVVSRLDGCKVGN